MEVNQKIRKSWNSSLTSQWKSWCPDWHISYGKYRKYIKYDFWNIYIKDFLQMYNLVSSWSKNFRIKGRVSAERDHINTPTRCVVEKSYSKNHINNRIKTIVPQQSTQIWANKHFYTELTRISITIPMNIYTKNYVIIQGDDMGEGIDIL